MRGRRVELRRRNAAVIPFQSRAEQTAAGDPNGLTPAFASPGLDDDPRNVASYVGANQRIAGKGLGSTRRQVHRLAEGAYPDDFGEGEAGAFVRARKY